MSAPKTRAPAEHPLSGSEIGLPLVKSVGSIRSRSAQRIAWHGHDGVELIFLIEGATSYEFQGAGTLDLAGGQFLLVPSHARHRGRHDIRSPSVLCGILFQPDRRRAHETSPFTAVELVRLNDQLRAQPPSVRTMSRELRGIVARLAELVRIFRQQRSRGNTRSNVKPQLRAVICLAIMEAARLLAERERAGATQMVAAAQAFLRSRHGDTVQMNELAAHLGLGRARMFEIFKSETGLSPNDFLQRHRIEEAKTLLADSRRSITDIAMETGFGSSQYFSRVFRKYCGVTPGDFRRRK